jgi:hypothetical protein
MAKVIFKDGTEREVKNLLIWRKSGIPISGTEMVIIQLFISAISFLAGFLIHA